MKKQSNTKTFAGENDENFYSNWLKQIMPRQNGSQVGIEALRKSLERMEAERNKK